MMVSSFIFISFSLVLLNSIHIIGRSQAHALENIFVCEYTEENMVFGLAWYLLGVNGHLVS